MEFGESEYEKVEMPDNIVELSLFMCVNWAYAKHKKEDNCLKRLFVLLLEA